MNTLIRDKKNIEKEAGNYTAACKLTLRMYCIDILCIAFMFNSDNCLLNDIKLPGSYKIRFQ